MRLRKYRASDCRQLAELFYQTVHSVNAVDYTSEQLDAWADGNIDLNAWNESFIAHYTVVCIKDDRIAGFGDIDKTGYLDRLFVHKDHQRQGVASAICDELERSVGERTIMTHASVTAKPFFEQRGYRVVQEQQAVRHGVPLTNYLMEKRR
ncbi:MAG: GNAT family N-acetyltransferase [Christensenellaceae bacterium]